MDTVMADNVVGATGTVGVVLIHGGSHTSRCWTPTRAELRRRAPELDVVTVDLPGRGSIPGTLRSVSIGDFVKSAVEQIERSGLNEVILVGHSMAGITLPGVAAALGPDRVRRMIFIATCVPAQGETVLDTLEEPLRTLARFLSRHDRPSRPFPGPIAAYMFCNGMSPEQRRFSLSDLVPEASSITKEKVDRSDLPPEIPKTWVLTLRDHSLTPARQRRFIDNLGGVDDVVEIDTCHNAMISAPEELADILLARVP
jgi:pimeloyl-ACP methyl ester carboxylesterase